MEQALFSSSALAFDVVQVTSSSVFCLFQLFRLCMTSNFISKNAVVLTSVKSGCKLAVMN